jgi:hypothetical protein
MEFGKVTDLQAIDFTLPADHPRTAHQPATCPKHSTDLCGLSRVGE